MKQISNDGNCYSHWTNTESGNLIDVFLLKKKIIIFYLLIFFPSIVNNRYCQCSINNLLVQCSKKKKKRSNPIFKLSFEAESQINWTFPSIYGRKLSLTPCVLEVHFHKVQAEVEAGEREGERGGYNRSCMYRPMTK